MYGEWPGPGEIIKQAVIDGILMEEDGSISNISRF